MIYEDCEVYFGYEGDVNAIIIGHPAECKKSNLLIDYKNIEKLIRKSIDLLKYCDKIETISYLFERDEEDVRLNIETVGENKLVDLYKLKFGIDMVVCDQTTAYIKFMKEKCDE